MTRQGMKVSIERAKSLVQDNGSTQASNLESWHGGKLSMKMKERSRSTQLSLKSTRTTRMRFSGQPWKSKMIRTL